MKTFQKILLVAVSAIFLTTQAQAIMYWARPYDPNLQRWLTRDPLGDEGSLVFNSSEIQKSFAPKFRPGMTSQQVINEPIEKWTDANLNLYVYVANNPITKIDPLGLDWLDCLNNCMKKYDPLPCPAAKFALLGLGPLPKPPLLGSTPFTNVPRAVFGLRGLGRSWLVRYVTIPTAVVYGSYLAGLEASCSATCGLDDTSF